MELYGLSLTHHLDNIFRELQESGSIYGFPLKGIYRPKEGLDVSTTFHGKRAASPLGPASGPHTQMVQNIVLAFLGGCRIMELKTVQILDELEIPRPCIDARTIGFNVEWSQEMKLKDSYHEYVVAWMILKILEEAEVLGYPKGDPFYDTIFDMSVGYDLKGISSEPVSTWITNIKNAADYIARMQASLPERYAAFKTLSIDPVVSNTLTLSTFHGCPRDEIQDIVTYLVGEMGLDVYVKMNPTQLGYARVDALLRQQMGYRHLSLDPKSFELDLQFDDGVAMMRRLVSFAGERGRTVGAKFTNTLVVKNHDSFFEEELMYLSGTPLHVLSINAMVNFRKAMGADFPVSFSAGINRNNFTAAVCCNMVPVTSCTDLLLKGGYTRAVKYLRALEAAMTRAGVSRLADLMTANAPQLGPAEAGLAFAEAYAHGLADNPQYHYKNNQKPPKKVDSALSTFDCLTCNICLPVCPNAANFSIPLGKREMHFPELAYGAEGIRPVGRRTLVLEKDAQIANLADFCNECANCEVFCPETGGPQNEKPRFFNTLASFREAADHGGFVFVDGHTLLGRFGDKEHRLQCEDPRWVYTDPDVGELVFDSNHELIEARPQPTLKRGAAIDCQPFMIMKTLFEGVRGSGQHGSLLLKANTLEEPWNSH